jgi:hypothetical protein
LAAKIRKLCLLRVPGKEQAATTLQAILIRKAGLCAASRRLEVEPRDAASRVSEARGESLLHRSSIVAMTMGIALVVLGGQARWTVPGDDDIHVQTRDFGRVPGELFR